MHLPFRTERVELRRFRAEDAPAFAAYRSHPEVARFQAWESDFTEADAERLIAGMERVELGTPGAWLQLAVTSTEDGSVLGDCAIHVREDVKDTVEVAATLAPSHQGLGLAVEGAVAMTALLFGPLEMHRIIAEVDDRNEPAQRLMERVGFRLEGRFVEADWFKGEWTTLRVYGMLAREWNGQTGL